MNAFVDWMAYWLADFYLAATVLLAAALGAMAACRQPAKRLAVAKAAIVALALLAALCALPGWSPLTLRWTEAEVTVDVSNQTPAIEVAPAALAPVVEVGRVAEATPQALPAAQTGPVANGTSVSWQGVLVAAYLPGCGVMAVWLLAGMAAARQLVRRAEPASKELGNELRAADDGGPTRVELLVSREIDVAVALGVFRPRVLLPQAWVEARSTDEMRAILCHELAHVRNGDLNWLALSRLLQILLWAQPLHWWLRRQMRLDQETLADVAAAERTGRRQYAEQLVAWARDVSVRPRPLLPASVGLWEGASQLRRRVAVLLDEKLTVLRRCSRRWLWGATATLSALTLTLSAATLEPAESSEADAVAPASDSETVHTSMGAGAVAVFSAAGEQPKVASGKLNRVALKLVDEAGRSVAGVEVSVYRVSPSVGGPERVASATSDVRGEVQFVDLVSAEKMKGYQALRAQGQFPTVAGDIFYIPARKAGLATVILPASESTLATEGVQREVRMLQAAKLAGRVTDADGKPVANALVAAGGMAGMFAVEGINAVRTDGAGKYELANLVAFDRAAAEEREAKGLADALRANRTATIDKIYDPSTQTTASDLSVSHPDFAVTTKRGGNVPGTTDVMMESAASIEGRVVDFASGKPAAKVQVNASGRLASAEADDKFWRVGPPIGGMHSAATRTDTEGRYRLSNLPAGQYDVWAAAPHSDSANAEWVNRGVGNLQVAADAKATSAPDLVIGPGARIRGQLVDRNGTPLPITDDVTLQAVGMMVGGPNQQSMPFERVSLAADGKFEFRIYPGKFRVFLVVQEERRPGGGKDITYSSSDDWMQAGQVFDLKHGESVEAKFEVVPQAQLNSIRELVQRGMEAQAVGDYEAAIAVFDEVLKTDPKTLSAIAVRGNSLEHLGRDGEALADYEKAAEITGMDPFTCWRMADLLATSNDPQVRDGRRAVEIATKVLEAIRQQPPSAENEANVLALLAAAQAETGDFKSAVATQREAVAKAPEALRQTMEGRVKLYEYGKPYRREKEE